MVAQKIFVESDRTPTDCFREKFRKIEPTEIERLVFLPYVRLVFLPYVRGMSEK